MFAAFDDRVSYYISNRIEDNGVFAEAFNVSVDEDFVFFTFVPYLENWLFHKVFLSDGGIEQVIEPKPRTAVLLSND